VAAIAALIDPSGSDHNVHIQSLQQLREFWPYFYCTFWHSYIHDLSDWNKQPGGNEGIMYSASSAGMFTMAQRLYGDETNRHTNSVRLTAI